jgi:hypothetical protein
MDRAARSTIWPFPERAGLWKAIAMFCFFPVCAALHHLVFYRNMCMLNSIGADYHPGVVLMWLSRDPSPWVGAIIAVITYVAGTRFTTLRILVAPLVIASIPLSIWIWDIPFTGRTVCYALHDGRLRIGSFPVTTGTFYVLSMAIYIGLLSYRALAARATSRDAPKR